MSAVGELDERNGGRPERRQCPVMRLQQAASVDLLFVSVSVASGRAVHISRRARLPARFTREFFAHPISNAWTACGLRRLH